MWELWPQSLPRASLRDTEVDCRHLILRLPTTLFSLELLPLPIAAAARRVDAAGLAGDV